MRKTGPDNFIRRDPNETVLDRQAHQFPFVRDTQFCVQTLAVRAHGCRSHNQSTRSLLVIRTVTNYRKHQLFLGAQLPEQFQTIIGRGYEN